MNIRKASDIAAIDSTSAISTDGFVYIWGWLASLKVRKPIICEHTNIFDICNSMTGQSPISIRTYRDEEYSLLKDFKAAFNDRVSLTCYLILRFVWEFLRGLLQLMIC